MYLIGETMIRDPKAEMNAEQDTKNVVEALEQENTPLHIPLHVACGKIPPVYHSFKAKRLFLAGF
ncbi:hypothetical protein [Ferruginibacter sp.]